MGPGLGPIESSALAQAMRSPEWQARVLEQGARLAHLRGE